MKFAGTQQSCDENNGRPKIGLLKSWNVHDAADETGCRRYFMRSHRDLTTPTAYVTNCIFLRHNFLGKARVPHNENPALVLEEYSAQTMFTPR